MRFPKGFEADSYAVFLKKKAEEDFDGAEFMINRRGGYALYFAHAAIQKTMAVIICKKTRKMPPWRRDLIRLARFTNVKLTKEQREICRMLNFYHNEGLYLGLHCPEPSKKEARNYLAQAKRLAASLPNPLAK
ncbi:MAG: HEPN domain-containing protein [Anaerolineae bacterium]|nr:HEPN domain-containing protein [Anaerolineae bacterium]MCI0607514.1 HEPN domain-containing protein [Anaerolineae bacterium]